MANSYIELPKFFANNVINNETDYDAIIIEEGLDELGGKLKVSGIYIIQ